MTWVGCRITPTSPRDSNLEQALDYLGHVFAVTLFLLVLSRSESFACLGMPIRPCTWPNLVWFRGSEAVS